MSSLNIEHVTKSFEGQVVLDDIQIEARAGELLVVLGPSGCGKSTLLRLIAGLETPDSGRIISHIWNRRSEKRPWCFKITPCIRT